MRFGLREQGTLVVIDQKWNLEHEPQRMIAADALVLITGAHIANSLRIGELHRVFCRGQQMPRSKHIRPFGKGDGSQLAEALE